MDSKQAVLGDLSGALAQLAKVKPRDSSSTTALALAKGRVRDAQTKVRAEPGAAPPPPPPPPVEPPASTFAPDLWYPAKASDIEQRSGGTLIQPTDGSITWGIYERQPCIIHRTGNQTGVAISGNPRTEVIGPSFGPGAEFWVADWMILPTMLAKYLPLHAPSGATFMGTHQIFGSPANGSPPVKIEILGSGLGWQRNAAGSFHVMWTRPLTLGVKITTLQRIVINKALGADGLVEQWINGEPVIKAEVPIYESSTSGGRISPRFMDYRSLNMIPETVEIIRGIPAIGTRRELVEYH